MKKCIGYIRVSSNGQTNGDGLKRQKDSIQEYCKTHKFDLVEVYSDEGVSGTLLYREGLQEVLESPVHTVIIEKLDRLGRDLIVSENIIKTIQDKGKNLISTKEGKDLLDENPSRVMIRQILSSVSQYEKSVIVERLRVARERIKKEIGKCEGRKSIKEISPETLKRIKQLRRKPRLGKKLSYKVIAETMNTEGFSTTFNKTFTPDNVRMICKRF